MKAGAREMHMRVSLVGEWYEKTCEYIDVYRRLGLFRLLDRQGSGSARRRAGSHPAAGRSKSDPSPSVHAAAQGRATR